MKHLHLKMNPGRTFLNEDGEKMINACDHVFDCIEMGQGYHFHQGQVGQVEKLIV